MVDYENLYLKFLKTTGKNPKTISTYSFAIHLFRKWRIVNHTLVKEVNPEHIANYKKYLINSGLKPSTINLCIHVLFSFYDFLSQEGFVKGNPINIKRNRLDFEHNHIKPYSNHEIDQINAILSDLPFNIYLALNLLINSGISPGELCKLTPKNLLIVKRHVLIKVEKRSKSYRLVPIINEKIARDILILIIDNLHEHKLFPISERSFLRLINTLKEEFKIDLSVKKMKKYYAENLVKMGCSKETIRWVLGYSSTRKYNPQDLFPYTVKI